MIRVLVTATYHPAVAILWEDGGFRIDYDDEWWTFDHDEPLDAVVQRYIRDHGWIVL